MNQRYEAYLEVNTSKSICLHDKVVSKDVQKTEIGGGAGMTGIVCLIVGLISIFLIARWKCKGCMKDCHGCLGDFLHK